MTPQRLTPSIHFQSSSVSSATGAIGPIPALLQTMWTAPNALSASLASASTLAASLTSVTTGVAPSSAAALCSALSSMSAMITCDPSALSCRAIPFPIPDAPPVTTATFPLRSARALTGCLLHPLPLPWPYSFASLAAGNAYVGLCVPSKRASRTRDHSAISQEHERSAVRLGVRAIPHQFPRLPREPQRPAARCRPPPTRPAATLTKMRQIVTLRTVLL